ncbi:MAG: hypothetical protein V7K89_08125 [Nostoc sp.]|uniref:hypothetical protein n=1 Tax=Nostoc sp. TaxID=1180 RepID=UPI002FF5F2B4
MPTAASYTPLGVVSPQFVQGVSEKEEDLPMAMDCTTLTLVEDAPNQSASLAEENQDRGVEPKDCHEGAYSAAPVAQNLTDLEEQAQASLPTSLKTENSVSGEGVKAVHEGEGSAAPVTSAEKWSHEAIVARSNMRPKRM